MEKEFVVSFYKTDTLTVRRIRGTIFAVEKQQISNITRVYVRILALVIRHAERMRRVILPSVTCEPLLCFPTAYMNGTTSGIKKFILRKMRVFPLPMFSESFLILRRIQRDIAKTFIRLQVKYALLMSDFIES